MKKFNKKKVIIISLISIILLGTGSYIYYNSIPKEEPLIGAYLDGTYSETLPSKGEGYAVDKIVCDNNKNASWDYDKWAIKLSNWGTRSRCNIYFKSLESFTIANKTFYLDEMQRCPSINSDGTVTLTGTEDTYGYICKAKDDYGDSYYYRGNVTNNYVKFGTWSNDTPTLVVDKRGFQHPSLEACYGSCTELARAGKDMYWRIIRYNGDGSVRVIYDGTATYANGKDSPDRLVGKSDNYNEYWKKDNVKFSEMDTLDNDNAGVGYMYGNMDGLVKRNNVIKSDNLSSSSEYYISKEYTYNTSTDKFSLKDPIKVKGSDIGNYIGYYTYGMTTGFDISYNYDRESYIFKIKSVDTDSGIHIEYSYTTYGSNSLKSAQTNTNNSEIKDDVDSWYEKNIKGTSNEKYVVDKIFCNDRSISSYKATNYTNNGYALEPTLYRWGRTYWVDTYQEKYNVILTCPQKNDAFTVRDTTKGNGDLTYPIGLITGDEAMLAGGVRDASNENYYLYTGLDYFTMTPSEFRDSALDAMVGCIYSRGELFSSYTYGFGGMKPVLNLSPEVLNNGDGTASNPFHP